MAMTMPQVSDCSVDKCSYNQSNQCHAMAITVGDKAEPVCDTFVQSPQQGGVSDMTAGVGACKTADCQFNTNLECTASSIHVGLIEGQPDCLTYKE